MQLKNRAFTLIELLVVIAIIAILAAILFPVFAQAKAAAKKSVCLSNNKQIALSTSIYSGDYDDYCPTSWWWNPGANDPKGFMDDDLQAQSDYATGVTGSAPKASPLQQLYPYLKSMDLLKCSSTTASSTTGWTPVTVSGGGNSSYMYNGSVRAQSLANADQISNLIVWQEGPAVTRVSFVQPEDFDTTHHSNGVDISWAGVTHGGDGGNYSFADGHAKFVKRNAVSWAMFGFTGTIWDGSDGTWHDNTWKMHLQTSATNYWYSCGHVDISATLTASGGDVCG